LVVSNFTDCSGTGSKVARVGVRSVSTASVRPAQPNVYRSPSDATTSPSAARSFATSSFPSAKASGNSARSWAARSAVGSAEVAATCSRAVGLLMVALVG
jgi:hypothetical protein